MYLKFFGLTAKPFELTPDPKFLFLTPGHREALAQLTYGIQEQKGFILMTGEVGTGKTTLLRTLAERFGKEIEAAFVLNSTLPFDEILEYTLADFGIPDPRGSRAQRLIALNQFLIEQRRAGRKTLLIIDEAQNLAIETLEQIRLLSNFETSTAKLVQIILSGQPELYAKLQLPELRQLKQRIAMRCTLRPMTGEEVGQYITSHLRIAGTTGAIFTAAAVRAIERYSAGLPRVVNIVCDHCLLIAYADQTREVDVAIVNRAIRYLEDAAPVRGFTAAATRRSGILRFSKRAVVGCSAGAVGAAAVAAALDAPGSYRSALHSVSAAMVEPIGGVVRWLTTWWGS